MSTIYDLIVIGGGSAGMPAARRAASYTKKVLLIDDRGVNNQPSIGKNSKNESPEQLGGTCVNVGCVPKKICWNISEVIGQMQIYSEYFNIRESFSGDATYDKNFQDDITSDDGKCINPVKNPSIHFRYPHFLEMRNKSISRLNHIYSKLLRNAGVEAVCGRAVLMEKVPLERVLEIKNKKISQKGKQENGEIQHTKNFMETEQSSEKETQQYKKKEENTKLDEEKRNKNGECVESTMPDVNMQPHLWPVKIGTKIYYAHRVLLATGSRAKPVTFSHSECVGGMGVLNDPFYYLRTEESSNHKQIISNNFTNMEVKKEPTQSYIENQVKELKHSYLEDLNQVKYTAQQKETSRMIYSKQRKSQKEENGSDLARSNTSKSFSKAVLQQTHGNISQMCYPTWYKTLLFHTSDSFFYLKTLPKRIVLIGSGYISVELSFILKSWGCEIYVIARGDKFLSHMDQMFSERVQRKMEQVGIIVYFQEEIINIVPGDCEQYSKNSCCAQDDEPGVIRFNQEKSNGANQKQKYSGEYSQGLEDMKDSQRVADSKKNRDSNEIKNTKDITDVEVSTNQNILSNLKEFKNSDTNGNRVDSSKRTYTQDSLKNLSDEIKLQKIRDSNNSSKIDGIYTNSPPCYNLILKGRVIKNVNHMIACIGRECDLNYVVPEIRLAKQMSHIKKYNSLEAEHKQEKALIQKNTKQKEKLKGKLEQGKSSKENIEQEKYSKGQIKKEETNQKYEIDEGKENLEVNIYKDGQNPTTNPEENPKKEIDSNKQIEVDGTKNYMKNYNPNTDNKSTPNQEPDQKKDIPSSITNKIGYLRVDSNFETSLKNVFATGDLLGPPFMLTPYAIWCSRKLMDLLFTDKKMEKESVTIRYQNRKYTMLEEWDERHENKDQQCGDFRSKHSFQNSDKENLNQNIDPETKKYGLHIYEGHEGSKAIDISQDIAMLKDKNVPKDSNRDRDVPKDDTTEKISGNTNYSCKSIQNFENTKPLLINIPCVPSVIFSHPPCATVGHSEQSAIALYGKQNIKILESEFVNLFYTLMEQDKKEKSLFKLVMFSEGCSEKMVQKNNSINQIPENDEKYRGKSRKDKYIRDTVTNEEFGDKNVNEELLTNNKSLAPVEDLIIGIHLYGHGTDELIQGLAVALRKGLTRRELARIVGVHPTAGEEIVFMGRD